MMNELELLALLDGKMNRLEALFRESQEARLRYEQTRRQLSEEMSSLRRELRQALDEALPEEALSAGSA